MGGRGLSLGGGLGLWRGRMYRGGRTRDWLGGRIGTSESVSSKHPIKMMSFELESALKLRFENLTRTLVPEKKGSSADHTDTPGDKQESNSHGRWGMNDGIKDDCVPGCTRSQGHHQHMGRTTSAPK